MTSAYSSTPAQWADDWLTPDERRALRADEASPRPLSRVAPAKPISVQPRAIPTRSKLSRVVQRIAQALAYATIAGAIVGLWYIGCLISWVIAAH